MRERKIGEFSATDASGGTHVVHVIQQFIFDRSLDGRADWLPGLKRLETSDGMPVNRIDAGKYEVVGFSRTALTSNDPNAP